MVCAAPAAQIKDTSSQLALSYLSSAEAASTRSRAKDYVDEDGGSIRVAAVAAANKRAHHRSGSWQVVCVCASAIDESKR